MQRRAVAAAAATRKNDDDRKYDDDDDDDDANAKPLMDDDNTDDSSGNGKRSSTRLIKSRNNLFSCTMLMMLVVIALWVGLVMSSHLSHTVRIDKSEGKNAKKLPKHNVGGDSVDNDFGISAHYNHNDDIRMTTSPTTNATLHIIFSTDCGSFQHWQSYLFFHSAYKIHQRGYITRIASGCTTTEQNEAQVWHNTHIRSRMSDRYRIHFTPHFSKVKDHETGEYMKDYKFFNKPFGLKHFMEFNELMGFENDNESSSGTRRMKHPNDVIILADPDFVLLRQLSDDFSNEREVLVGKRRQSIFFAKETHLVSRGNPYAQTYGLGAQWRRFDIDAIAGPNSPAKSVDQTEGGLYFPAGPPYIVVASDMYAISEKWSEFAPKVYKQYPHLLAEMYAYCIAAAHLNLRHMLVDSLMISASGAPGEGWKFIRDMPANDVCNIASNPDHSVHAVPSVIHYCQRYGIDKYFWGKKKMNHNIFTCEHSLLIEPPSDLGSGKYIDVLTKGKNADPKLSAFMICALTKATNDAMVYFKSGYCDGGGNRKKEYAMMA